jgi:hypothetical protein
MSAPRDPGKHDNLQTLERLQQRQNAAPTCSNAKHTDFSRTVQRFNTKSGCQGKYSQDWHGEKGINEHLLTLSRTVREVKTFGGAESFKLVAATSPGFHSVSMQYERQELHTQTRVESHIGGTWLAGRAQIQKCSAFCPKAIL